MARTTTLYVDIRKLARDGPEGAIVMRLMMALNDLATANEALGRVRAETCEKTEYIRRGAQMYFVRIQMGHLREAFLLLEEIDKSRNLRSLVDLCPDETASLFSKLLRFAKGGAEHDDFLRYVELVRHNIAFHYSPKKVLAALRDRATRWRNLQHRITLSDDFRLVRCQIADDVVNTLVCHHLWAIPPGPDTQGKADQITGTCFEIYRMLVDFVAGFVKTYIEKHAAFGN
jgi:hypothetical protein